MGAPTAMRAALDALRASTATAQPERSVGKNAKASLLYDAKSAADIDRETLHAIGASGFEELCRRDGRFEAHARGLFGRAVAEGKHRELEDAKESAATSARIGGYLKLLSGYFTEKAASKTLEYLIRRFKIHVYDVDAFIACAMPWHSTPEFVKACQVCQLENSKHFKWLTGVKETGAAPPRDALAVRCSKDKAFFTFCAESAAEMATAKVTSFFVASVFVEKFLLLLLPTMIETSDYDRFVRIRARVHETGWILNRRGTFDLRTGIVGVRFFRSQRTALAVKRIA